MGRLRRRLRRLSLSAVTAVGLCGLASLTGAKGEFFTKVAAEPPATGVPRDDAAEPSARQGYRILRERPFLPADFRGEEFERLWTVWPSDLRDRAASVSPAERREMTFARYGLHEPPEAGENYAGPDLGHVDDGRGGWVMNCFACHGGSVLGRVIPGLPNTDLDLQSLVEDAATLRLQRLERPSHLGMAALKMPLSGSRGTTNAVAFGVVLAGLRNPDMSVDLTRSPGPLLHPDMDAPPWWHLKKKSRLYADGFSPKNHRVLMQFLLLPENDREIVHAWEPEFRHVLAYLDSVEPPKYPGRVDADLAARGRVAFERNCSKCHGRYGERETYPERTVALAEIGTDPLRHRALTVAHRTHLRGNWMTFHGRDETVVDPVGYVAPPLDGIWATAPYLHNGSVPTLWHLLHPAERPTVWRRSRDGDSGTSESGYDPGRVGFAVEEWDELPDIPADPVERRRLFDTRRPGKSAAGHDYPNALTEQEKRAVLEYLKTL